MNTKADLILHPVRMRILQALSVGSAGRRLTATQLAAELPGVSQATLYRHLRRLTEGGILQVVEERPVHGAVERVYALPATAAVLGPVDLADATREDHVRYFATFVASLLGDFGRYLERERIDLLADGVGYRQAVLELSDEEFAALVQRLNEALLPALANGPAPGRTRRIFSTIVMPVPEGGARPEQEQEETT